MNCWNRTRHLVPPFYLVAGGHDCNSDSTSSDPVTCEHDGHAMSVGRYQSLVRSVLSFHFDVGATSTVWARHVNVHNYSSTTLVSIEHYGGVKATTTTSTSELGVNRTDSRRVIWGVGLYLTWAAKELLEEDDLFISFNIA